MRKTEAEVKAELIKRRDKYLQHRQTVRTRVIAAVVCLALIAGTVAAVNLLPNKNTAKGGNNLIYNSIETPFDQSQSSTPSRDDSEQSYPPISGEASESPEANASLDNGDNSFEYSDSPQYPLESGEETSYEEDSNYIEDSTDGSTGDDPYDSDKPPQGYDSNVEVDMIYPTLPEDGSSLDLLKTLSTTGVNGNPVNNSFASAYASFASTLFKGCAVGKNNTLISPLSIMLALAVTANGAAGDTKWYMESALGGFSVDQLNNYLCNYVNNLPGSENTKLSISNSVWIKEGFGVNKDFLQNCLDYYGADAYMSSFDDQTKDEVNAWISENTDGLIQNALKDAPTDALMLIVNALLFDARWERTFNVDVDQKPQPFTNADYSTTDVLYMYSKYDPEYVATDHDVMYLDNALATGFVKQYEGGYAFVALLPKQIDGLNDLVVYMTGNRIMSTLANAQAVNISYSIPQFRFEASVDKYALKQTLTDMGMGEAFDREQADFSRIHNGDGLYIDSIMHDTCIEVNSKGTKAAESTIVAMAPTGGPPEEKEIKYVYLNRPFMYMIVDTANSMPIFMGTVTDMSKSLPVEETPYTKEEIGRDYWDALECTRAEEGSYYQGAEYPANQPKVTVLANNEEYDAYYAENLASLGESRLENFGQHSPKIVVETIEPNASFEYKTVSMHKIKTKESCVLNINIEISTRYNGMAAVNDCITTHYSVIDIYYEYLEDVTDISVNFTGYRQELEALKQDNVKVECGTRENWYTVEYKAPIPQPVVITSVEQLQAFCETYKDLFDMPSDVYAYKRIGFEEFLKICEKEYTAAYFQSKALIIAMDEQPTYSFEVNYIKENGAARLQLVGDKNDPQYVFKNLFLIEIYKYYLVDYDGSTPEIVYED